MFVNFHSKNKKFFEFFKQLDAELKFFSTNRKIGANIFQIITSLLVFYLTYNYSRINLKPQY